MNVFSISLLRSVEPEGINLLSINHVSLEWTEWVLDLPIHGIEIDNVEHYNGQYLSDPK